MKKFQQGGFFAATAFLYLFPILLYGGDYYVVNINSLNVRNSPNSSTSTVIGKLSQGDTINSISIEGKWVLFQFNTETKGYVHSSKLVKIEAPVTENEDFEFSADALSFENLFNVTFKYFIYIISGVVAFALFRHYFF